MGAFSMLERRASLVGASMTLALDTERLHSMSDGAAVDVLGHEGRVRVGERGQLWLRLT